MTERYFRCQNDACRKKWHHTSIMRIATPKHVILEGQLDLSTIDPLPPMVWQCPSCRGDVEPEDGTFEELFKGQAA